MEVTGTAASMLESVRVLRRCWANDEQNVALAQFRVTWKTPGNKIVGDSKTFVFRDLMRLQVGVVPMLTAIFDPEAKPERIEAHAYLIRVHNPKDNLPDVVARLIVQTEHAGPDEPFVLSGTLSESGPNIYPLTIEDDPLPED